MVARDGIEPPTPAFSGPRSTTELSGLGITLLVGDRQEPPRAISTSVALALQRACCRGEPATRERNLSIAIQRSPANLRRSRYPFSIISTAQGCLCSPAYVA